MPSAWTNLCIAMLLGLLYLAYHCLAVHRFLEWHKEYVRGIIERAKRKEELGVFPANRLKYSYDEVVSKEQFLANMDYFRSHRDERGGFYLDGRVMTAFSESCTFLGGARAALLQIAHPMVAIAVRKHSYIIKKSQATKKKKGDGDIDLVHDCDYRMLSKALKLRFNRTFAVLFPIIYGPLDESLSAAKRAWAVHSAIHGQLQSEDDAEVIGDGRTFNQSTFYSATMTMPLRWVWATLVEGSLFMQQMMGTQPYGAAVTESDALFFRECYQGQLPFFNLLSSYFSVFCALAASANTAMAFGLSKDQIPKTAEEFEEYYWSKMMESEHIVISRDCSKWSKVFFMANHWYRRPTNYALKCYTAMLFPESVRRKFNEYDPTLLPDDRMSYFYGLLWLGLSRGVYALLPESVRLLNDYMAMKERMEGSHHWNAAQRMMKAMSGYAAQHIVASFIEG